MTDAAQALIVAIRETLDFPTAWPTTQSVSGGSAQFIPSFSRSGCQLGDNVGVVTVAATAPATQLASNTLQIPWGCM